MPKHGKTKLDAVNDFLTKDKIYCDMFRCPNCEYEQVLEGDKFCSNCGCEFEWINVENL